MGFLCVRPKPANRQRPEANLQPAITAGQRTYGPVVKPIAWHGHGGSLPNLIAITDAEG
jgi:hypothetical protein